MGMRPVFYSRITQPFADPGGYASDSDSHGPAGHHTGIDWGSMWPRPIDGKPVRSCTLGMVVISEYNSTMGNWVGVWYAQDNVTITYWHMATRLVRVGQTVTQGQQIGTVGNTGNSTAPHIHVQVNTGRGFIYDAHVHPGKWCTGMAWWKTFMRKQSA